MDLEVMLISFGRFFRDPIEFYSNDQMTIQACFPDPSAIISEEW
jgi:hypothetical protein